MNLKLILLPFVLLGCFHVFGQPSTKYTAIPQAVSPSKKGSTLIAPPGDAAVDTLPPPFDASTADLIDSLDTPMAYLYNQHWVSYFEGDPSQNDVQYLIINSGVQPDTIVAGENADNDYPFDSGKIIAYVPYQEGDTGIVVSLTYAAEHDGSGWAASNTYLTIFDVKTGKKIFNCQPYFYSDEWQFLDTTNRHKHSYGGFDVAIKGNAIIIKKRPKERESADNRGIISEPVPGTYRWKGTEFMKVK